ncbi:MAG: pilus assembly protein PilM [Oscillospiraceae bacterium]
MATKVLNIETGDHITKVCVAEKRSKSYQISNSFLFRTPSGAVRDGQVVNVESMAEELRRQLKDHGASGVKTVTFTLTSTKVASREVILPPVKDQRIKSVVETNAADYFPVDMSGYCIAHCLLERQGGDNPGCRVQVTAAPRILLESYASLAEATGLTLEAVDYCGNSQYQVLRTLSEEGVVMYVDVNVSNTFVSFMKNGVLLMQRNISAGGNEILSSLLEAGGKDPQEFLSVLGDAARSEYLDGLLPREQQEDCLNRLVTGIARSADFFKSGHASIPVTKVVLMGVCGAIAGLREMVQKEIGLETVTLQDVNGIRFVANSVGGINAYISCVGSLVAPLELLPESMRGGQKKKSKKDRRNESLTAGVVACLVLTVLAAGLAGFSVKGYFSALQQQEQLEQRLQELDYVSQTVETYETYQVTEATLNEIRAYSESHNAYLVDFLEELERKMPSSMLLLSAVCDEQGVTMNIVTPGMEEANVVISQLRTFESIKQMTISTITESTDEGGFTTASFSVSCGYEEPVQEQQNAGTVQSDTAG